ncbi:MAG TPA: hypothetical protein VFA04_19945 [Bryobacteraceae bacterium]|nr:hypothetical protein [Bryobacteraceae bacterium]
MSSERRIRASRENGAKSHGPKTPEGKLRSSRNAIKHGLLSEIIVLPTEPAERFLQLSTELEDEFHPSTPFQRLQVESIAACAWRIRRVWALEKTAYKYEAGLMGPCQLPPDEKTYRSFRAMADFTRALELLSRYESRYERQMARAYKTLMDYDPENAPNEPNPEIEHQTDDPQPIDSTPEIEPNDGIAAQHTDLTPDPCPLTPAAAAAQHTAAPGVQPDDPQPIDTTPRTPPNDGIAAQHTAGHGPRTPGPGFPPRPQNTSRQFCFRRRPQPRYSVSLRMISPRARPAIRVGPAASARGRLETLPIPQLS